jgi:uncharacterized protein
MNRFAVFISIVLGIYGVLNIVAFQWLRFMFRPTEWRNTLFVLLFSIIVIMQPLGHYLMAKHPGRLSVIVMQTGFVWLGYLFYFFTLGVLTAIFVVIVKTAVAREMIIIPDNALSRGFPVAGGIILGSLTLLFLAGAYVAKNPVIRSFDIHVPETVQTSGPITVAHLTDTHLNELKTVNWWEFIVDKTNALNPDIIVLTGDIVDAEPDRLSRFKPGLSRLRARYGVFAVTGNHEFYINTNHFINMFQECGITVLRNETYCIPGVVCLVGIDDPTGLQIANRQKPDFEAINKMLPDHLPIIVLSHQPVYLDDIKRLNAHLMLSGHTHNGQLWPFGIFTRMVFRHSYGYRRFDDLHLYVGSGTGIWGPPFRVGTRSEIAVLRIVV